MDLVVLYGMYGFGLSDSYVAESRRLDVAPARDIYLFRGIVLYRNAVPKHSASRVCFVIFKSVSIQDVDTVAGHYRYSC